MKIHVLFWNANYVHLGKICIADQRGWGVGGTAYLHYHVTTT